MTPEDLYYSAEHEWVRLEEDVATVGITDFAQDQLGDIIFVQLPEVSENVAASSVVGELESTRSVNDIFCPVDGEVVVVNESLESNPEAINIDPYGEGWLFKVRIIADDIAESLLSPTEYTAITSA